MQLESIAATNDPALFRRQVAKLIDSGLVSRMFLKLHTGHNLVSKLLKKLVIKSYQNKHY